MSADGVSVVMPAHNAAQHIERAIASVAAQFYTDWELLVVDDASSDATGQIVRAHAKDDPRIKLIPLAQQAGAGEARNNAIRAAQGRYIAFLDADDAWCPDKLAIQIGEMKQRQLAFSFTSYYRGTPDAWQLVPAPKRISHAGLLCANRIGCLTAVYDRMALGRVEMPNYRLRQDYALWLTLLKRTDWAHGINTPLALHYRNPNSLSSNLVEANLATWRIYRDHAKLDPVRAAFCLVSHTSRRLFRGLSPRVTLAQPSDQCDPSEPRLQTGNLDR